jgi:hypothetical protein
MIAASHSVPYSGSNLSGKLLLSCGDLHLHEHARVEKSIQRSGSTRGLVVVILLGQAKSTMLLQQSGKYIFFG